MNTILVTLLLFSAQSVFSAELVTLETRSGVEQKFILIKSDNAKYSVIFFAGGKGVLNLSSLFGSPTINRGENNFLVRTRELFVKNDFMVAVVDAPSDKQSMNGMLGGFRDSEDHVTDIDHVISYLRKRASVPVWLVVTSRGTESAANIAIHSMQKPDGLVLTSSMSVANPGGTAVTEMDLKKISIPTLIVAHSDDACRKTPSEGAQKIANMLINAPKVEVKLFSGGDEPISRPCKARSYHGFSGIEGKVVDYISGFSIGIERCGSDFFLLLKAVGKLTHEDYETITPMIDSALSTVKEPKVKALTDSTEMEGWELRAAWDDFKLGLQHGNEFTKIAIYGNKNWQEITAKIGSWFISGKVKYSRHEKDAFVWLNE